MNSLLCSCLVILLLVAPVWAYPTVAFDVRNGLNTYAKFLDRLRNAVQAPKLVCGLKSLREEPLQGREYLNFKLQYSNTSFITVAVNTTNLYVVAYQDNVKCGGKFRANFFNDVTKEEKDMVFPGSLKRMVGVKSSYTDLCRWGIHKVPLGVFSLEHVLRSIHGLPSHDLDHQGQLEAKFFLLVIQMVSETAWFKYVERAIISGLNDWHTRFQKHKLNTHWSSISDAIYKAQNATPDCHKFGKPVQVGEVSYEYVAEIFAEIGVIKHE